MAKILIVEDEQALTDIMTDTLDAEGFLIDSVGNGDEAIAQLKFSKYDLIILDWSLPGADGLSVLKSFRATSGTTPVLMLTGRNEIEDRVKGLESGADDYLTKPFHMKELLARIKALLRRPPLPSAGMLTAGSIEVDPNSRRVFVSGGEIMLRPQEYALLEFLIRHPGQVFSSEALIQRVWPTDSEASASAVKIYVTRLRKKLEPGGGPLITTVHGVGYRLDV